MGNNIGIFMSNRYGTNEGNRIGNLYGYCKGEYVGGNDSADVGHSDGTLHCDTIGTIFNF
jgi:hypothetical protein